MPNAPNHAGIAAIAPAEPALTPYDHAHRVTYLRLLDAHAEGTDWREVVRIVLHIDPDRDPEQARKTFESHLARAQWMTEHGYRHLLKGVG
ncbi:DNA -binding domain-containing protein [Bradyrhizobium paxllaeri]|uniref:DNA -binding domain-containing protein n=1 Tax=Bradyrhizobium paxllaeri TaxID=190148 RepID=UPI00081058AC|nr:DUF2285 domain-containing protein [Bradyrhizobium paxllaeri]